MQNLLKTLLNPKIYALAVTVILLLFGITLWPERQVVREHNANSRHEFIGNGILSPLPENVVENAPLVALGAKLFSDKRLSRDESMACESCHLLDNAGVDGLENSVGIRGQIGTINAPTVFNASLNFRQFWDGRASSLEDQAAGPVQNPIEMGFTWSELVDRLKLDQDYKNLFSAQFPDGVTAKNIRMAIAAFEETLITPGAPFDRFLRGEANALTPTAKAGYQLFLDYGCVACHQGRNIGGSMYEKLGIVKPYYDESRKPKPQDLGRFNLTGDPEHKYEFKVPSLRNVAKTAPYFHDGSIATLEEAVRLMGAYQLGIDFSSQEVTQLVAFLNSLTGNYKGKPL